MRDFIIPVDSEQMLMLVMRCDGSFHQYLHVLSRTPYDEYAV